MNFIVTGANTGIGYETVNALLALNPDNRIFLACRDEAKANAAIQQLKQIHPNNGNMEFLPLDLGDLASVQASANAFIAKGIPLHVLILNAGLLAANQKTAQGYEVMFGVNHLGHFLYTQLLLPVLKSSAPSRIVVVASNAHTSAESSDIDLESLVHREYTVSTFFTGYANSKLLNIYFTNELSRQLEGTGVTVNCLHPGAVKTELSRYAPWYLKPVASIINLFLLSSVQGARTTVYVATSKDLEGVSGKYYDNCKEAKTKPYAQNKEKEEKLWALSTNLVQPFVSG